MRDPFGVAVPDGEEGEICARSAYVMLGYWNDETATAAAIGPDRWLRTGDFGVFEDGRLRLTGRRSDLILRGGENVYPLEIEQTIDEHPAVLECAVIGIDSADLGQEVAAVVVLRSEGAADEEELRDYVAERLGYFKVPVKWKLSTTPLPRNATGKNDTCKGGSLMTYDAVINNGLWFDGTGAKPAVRNLGIRDGLVTAISLDPLDETDCPRVIDARRKWVIPGIVDIHTHYDVEILEGPALSESLRHGVTSIFVGSCSLSTIHASPSDAGDLFGRVEAIPRKHVVDALNRAKTWNSASEYVAALEALPLGPNIAAFIGHSDMRAAEMGLDRATRKDVHPTDAELASMEAQLTEALDAGFVGMSSQQLLFDKLDGETCRSRTLPSTYATTKERRRLNAILRRRGRVFQAGPDLSNPMSTGAMAFSSAGIWRKRLKTSMLSAADIKSNKLAVVILGPLAHLVNRLGGDLRWQHLPVPFEVYADGIDLVVFEEFGSGAAALHLTDEMERNVLMQSEDYRRQFRKDYDQKFGVKVWHRDFFDAEIVSCPDESLVGKSFGQVGRRTWRPPPCRCVPGSGPRTRHERCVGAQPSRTTGRRFWTSSPRTMASNSGSPTPERICATWRSTTSAYAYYDVSTMPKRSAVRS